MAGTKKLESNYENYIKEKSSSIILREYLISIQSGIYKDGYVPLRSSLIKKERQLGISRATFDRFLDQMVKDKLFFTRLDRKDNRKQLYKLGKKHHSLLYRAFDKTFIESVRNVELDDGISIYGFPQKYMNEEDYEDFNNIMIELKDIQKRLFNLKVAIIGNYITKPKEPKKIIENFFIFLAYSLKDMPQGESIKLIKSQINNKKDRESLDKIIKELEPYKEKIEKEMIKIPMLESSGIFLHVGLYEAIEYMKESEGTHWDIKSLIKVKFQNSKQM